jgi:hypothetical protein
LASTKGLSNFSRRLAGCLGLIFSTICGGATLYGDLTGEKLTPKQLISDKNSAQALGGNMMKYLILFALYAAAITATELILGNENFPFHLWVFEKVKPVEWSLPIHLAGFFWIVIWNLMLKNKPFWLALLVSMLFFVAAELMNYSYLHWFAYTGGPLGRMGALILILLLYLILCGCMAYILRNYLTIKTY